MYFRIFFLLVTAFFVTMNVVLWRSEFSSGGRFSTSVPVEVVWKKVLTAPDQSRLAVWYAGRKIGYCTWAPNLTEPPTTDRSLSDEPAPEGMVHRLIGYTVDLDGSVAPAPDLRLRFNLHTRFDTNQTVQEFVGAVKLRPDTWEVRVNVARQTVAWQHEIDGRRTGSVLRLDRLQDLEPWLAELGLPIPTGFMATLGLGADGGLQLTPAALGWRWQMHNDWLPVGRARLRVYRADASLLGRYHASILISLIGEILQVDLPGGVRLHHEGLVGLQ